jgi:hypothetical protein
MGITVDFMSGVHSLLGVSINKIHVVPENKNENIMTKFELAIGIIFLSVKIYF